MLVCVSATLARISSAVAVQVNGRASAGATADDLVGDDAEPGLDLVDPRRADRGEVEADVRVVCQPLPHIRCGVSREVVEDDVDFLARVRFNGLLQKVEELRAVAGRAAFAVDLGGADVQCGEQVRCAVPDVVVVRFSVAPKSTGNSGWVRSSAWTCVFVRHEAPYYLIAI
jgi:hypothetical protein